MKTTRKTAVAVGSVTGAAALAVALAACTGGGTSSGQQQETTQQQADTNSLEQSQPSSPRR